MGPRLYVTSDRGVHLVDLQMQFCKEPQVLTPPQPPDLFDLDRFIDAWRQDASHSWTMSYVPWV